MAFTLLLPTGEETKTKTKTKTTLVIPRAHAATVTSAVLLRAAVPPGAVEEGGEERLVAVTAGSDQRVKVWEVVVERGALLDGEEGGSGPSRGVDAVRVRRLADEGTAVADVSDVVVLAAADEEGGRRIDGMEEEEAAAAAQRRTVVVVGVGMEAWGLDV